MSYRVIDLFAGIGGMRLAFERAGARTVFTSEWDKYAQKTYAANFPGKIAGDITTIDPESIPEHDILVAGFPCQPFSLAGVSKKNSLGRLHGFKDPTQGTLFFNIKSIIEAQKPRAFLLENVKHLVRHDSGLTFGIIMNTLRDRLGYDVQYRVLDGRAFVPQHRERVYIVGFKRPLDFRWPTIPVAAPRLGSILEQSVDKKYTLSDKLWVYLQEYARRHQEKGNGFGFGLFGPEDVARTLSARYYKDGSEILIRQRNRNPRRLTPRECASLMGFPENFNIPVSDTRAYKQFGNSVVVPMVEAIAKEIVACLQRNKTRPAAELAAQARGEQLQIRVPVSS